jgi:hypothetical protein
MKKTEFKRILAISVSPGGISDKTRGIHTRPLRALQMLSVASAVN